MLHAVQYKIANSVVMRVADSGAIVTTNSVSREPIVLDGRCLAVLRCYGRPRSPQAAYRELPADGLMSTGDFEAIVTRLVEANVLTAEAHGSDKVQTYVPARSRFGSVATHVFMLQDYVRTMTYRAAIHENVRGKKVLDLGCGSGILSLFAAQAGAERVYAIEESDIASLAKALFLANGYEDRITLIEGNSKHVELPERVDVLVHEILGIDPLAENIVDYVADARSRFLPEDGGQLIPYRVDVYGIGLEADFVPSYAKRMLLSVREFNGAYGFDFSPLANEVEDMGFAINDYNQWPHTRSGPGETFFSERMLSEEVLLRSIDLRTISEDRLPKREQTSMRIRHRGRLGAVLLFFRAHLDHRLAVTTSPFSPRTHWGWKVQDLSDVVGVEPGQEIAIATRLRTLAGRQKLFVDLVA